MNKLTGLIMMFVAAALMAVPVSAQTDELEAWSKEAALLLAANVPEFKVYEIKHQNAADIIKLMDGLIPSISYNSQFNTISLSAAPQVHTVVASIIEKYDVPRRTVEFQFFLIRAGNLDDDNQSEVIKDELPEKVRTALNELAGLMRYKNFQLIDAPFLRTLDGSRMSVLGTGNNEIDGYQIVAQGVLISNAGTIRIGSFKSSFYVRNTPGSTISTELSIDTALEFAEGETILVGTTQSSNKRGDPNTEANSIIVVVTAKIL